MTLRPSLVALALAALPSVAAGDPVLATVRLAWVRGADADACPDGAWLRDEVTRRLGRDPFDDDGPRSIEALVERAPSGWRAVLRVRDREGTLLGERTLTRDGDRCEPIVEASALAIALAVDPDAVIDETPRAPAAPVRRPPRRPRRPIAPPPPPSRPVSFGVQGGVVVGLTPSVAPAFGFGAAVELSARWSLRGHVDLAPTLASDDPRFAFGFTRATALGCVDPARGASLLLSLCAGASGAVVHAAARDVFALEAGDRLWLGATAAARVQWSPSPRWYVGLRAEASVAALRASYRFNPDASEIYTQPLLSGGGALELGLRSP